MSAMMSSMSSIPTDSRTRSGVTPVELLFFVGQLLVRRRGRMNHQRLGVADVRQQAEQLHRVDEGSARLVAALDAEREQRSRALRQVLLVRAY